MKSDENINDTQHEAGSVRTGLTIIMMMFFATLTLDLAVPAVILVGLLALDWLSALFKRGFIGEGRTA
ncbi:MAG TPA: hypothetical protein VL202_20425 [Pararhizobium sp.]|uniref:hypothetical protein n=1 Tax=Pararhizobium sp. TaxID=1977563 RepID=UPI002B5EDB91|nr:hypothetical protein [Pararhizobium sp.]HTO33517.1 hypothetical protein [Pararhizobium sp.]